jgi:hypothetical protein
MRFTTVKAHLKLSAVPLESPLQDYNLDKLARVVNTPGMNRGLVATWIDIAGSSACTILRASLEC